MRKIIDSIARDSKANISAIKKGIAPFVSLLKKSVDADVIVGGSLAKGTILSDDFDVDIFVIFDKDRDLSNLLEKALKKTKIPFERVHGSRDYFQLTFNDYSLELVPVRKIKSAKDAHNVTDMSPLHVKWVKDRIDERLAGDIRAAKLFCKSARIYGAESFIKGFSGHVLDILVAHYKGLDRLLKAAASWKIPVVVDPENHFKGRALILMNKSKIGPLIVVDPTDPTRNAAAAVSELSLKTFISRARRFVKKPSDSFFAPYEFDLKTIANKKGRKVIVVTPKVPEGKLDVVGAKLFKQFEVLAVKLAVAGFDIKSHDWFWDRDNFAVFWFVLDKADLPPKRVHQGPFVSQKDHAALFRKKYPKARKKGNRLVAEVPVPFRKAEELVKDVLRTSGAEIFVKVNR